MACLLYYIDYMEKEILNQSFDKLRMQYGGLVEPRQTYDASVNRGLCPYIKNPHKDCYCSEMQSQSSEVMIYYVDICGGNFEDCEIYKRLNKNEAS